MTVADEARDNALHCEMVKFAYRQTRDGVFVSFVVHPNDVPDELTKSRIGARYMVVLVQIGDDELPVPKRQAKERKSTAAPVDPKPTGAKRDPRDWRDVPPAAQSGIRCGEATFWAFLREKKGYPTVADKESATRCIRLICEVDSRVEFSTDHRKRVVWHLLDTEYQAWLAMERVGA